VIGEDAGKIVADAPEDFKVNWHRRPAQPTTSSSRRQTHCVPTG